jgi:hypothetical protein
MYIPYGYPDESPSNVPEISAFITNLEDFKKCMQHWKETTSTSPLGRHLGHYKTAILALALIAQLLL